MASCLILASFEHLKEVITRHKKYLINLVNSHMHLLNRVHAWLLSHIFCFIFSCASRVLPTSLPTYLSISHDIYLHSLPACCFYVTNHYPFLSLPLQPQPQSQVQLCSFSFRFLINVIIIFPPRGTTPPFLGISASPTTAIIGCTGQ